MKPKIPNDEKKFREAIYNGEIYLLSPTEQTLLLAMTVRDLVSDTFGENFRSVVDDLSGTFFDKVSTLRRVVFTNENIHQNVASLVESLGLNPSSFVFEPPKLRAVSHDGHHNIAAAPVYYGHRDTWYATSQSTINFWIPLSALEEDETFVFYPEVFDKSIPNNSASFSFEKDKLKIGWEKKTDGKEKLYPTMDADAELGCPLGFSPDFGSLLIFSGSHYHRTLAQSKHKTRFSLDFRLVHIADEKNNIGAPNVDNDSQGCSVSTYLNL